MRAARLPGRFLKGCTRDEFSFAERTRTIADPAAGSWCVNLQAVETVNWRALADEKRARYQQQHGEEDERAIVRRGNAAYAAGLALSMVDDPQAAEWLLRAAERWRVS